MADELFGIEKFKSSYLESLEDDLSEIESNLLSLESLSVEEYDKELFNIFRSVHSYKGSSDSYELFMLTIIFHKFEDLLTQQRSGHKVEGFIDIGIRFIDTLRNCVDDYRNDSDEPEKYVTIVEEISNQKSHALGKILVVETTKSIKKIFDKLAAKHNVELTIVNNGINALNRLLHERFDIVFASGNIHNLDGESLLKAISVMKGINQKVPMVLMSSDDKMLDNQFGIKFFKKDNNLIGKIDEILAKIIISSDDGEGSDRFSFKNVVFVEDDIMIQKIIGKVFKAVPNTNLHLAGDLETSLDLIIHKNPDLIVLDYFLKDCVGPDILQKLFEKNGHVGIPILFMTSTPDKVNINELSKFGSVKGVIEKPIKASRLLDEINRLT